MIRFLCIFMILYLVSCEFPEKEMTIKREFIKPFYRNSFLYPSNSKIKFVEIATFKIDLNGNNLLDTIKLRKVFGWNDAGKFHQIQITLDNNNNFEETNFDGWVKMGDNYWVNNDVIKANLINSDLLLITNINSSTRFIFAFGWIYSSNPGFLTIFEANGRYPQLIFNDQFALTSIENNAFTGRYQFDGKKCTISINKNKLTIDNL